jgi:hypothetical protein
MTVPVKMTNQQLHRSERAAEWARLKSRNGRFTGVPRRQRRDKLFHRGLVKRGNAWYLRRSPRRQA